MLEHYTIRPFEPTDRDAFLELFSLVHGTQKSGEWFDWKYRKNPYRDSLMMIVAEANGELIGARPLFSIPLRRGSWEGNARQPADAMVHPAHRRRGVFTGMLEQTVDRCRTEGVDVLFTFPNEKSGGAYHNLDWHLVGELMEFFRVHRPGRVIAARNEIPHLPGVASLAKGIVDASAISSRIGQPRAANVETRIESSVPVAALNDLYQQQIPDAIHAPRTNEFLAWRFSNPDWSYRAFLGYVEGELTAAIVTGTREMEAGGYLTRCVDVLPLKGDWRRDATLEVVLSDVIAAHDESDLFVFPGTSLPKEICRRVGFLPNDARPIDFITRPTKLYVNPLTDRARLSGVTNDEAWLPTFVEYDTA